MAEFLNKSEWNKCKNKENISLDGSCLLLIWRVPYLFDLTPQRLFKAAFTSKSFFFFLTTDNSLYCKSFVIILCHLKVRMSPLFCWDRIVNAWMGLPRLFFLSLSKCRIFLIRCGIYWYSRAAFIGNFAFICGVLLEAVFIGKSRNRLRVILLLSVAFYRQSF